MQLPSATIWNAGNVAPEEYSHQTTGKADSFAPDARQKKAGMVPARYGSLSGKHSIYTVLTCNCFYTHHPGSQAYLYRGN
jgi:hypothetical protein